MKNLLKKSLSAIIAIWVIIMLTIAGNTQGQSLSVVIFADSVLCYGMHDGTVTATASAGTLPYSYLWSSAQTTAVISGMPAGTYTVTVTDGAANTATASATVYQPAQLGLTLTADSVRCFGDTSSIMSIVTGGTSSYHYIWSDTRTSPNLTGVVAGIYTVTVTDHDGCTAVGSAQVLQPTQLNCIVATGGTDTIITCSDIGSIALNVVGGTYPWSYHWSNSDSTQNIMNLSGGVYTITITDHNGCTIIRSFFISQPSPMDVHIDSLNALCPDSCDGEITSAITGGTPFSSGNYHYIWSNGQTTENIDNLCPGIYDLTVTDSMGCVIVKSITVSVKINAYFIIYPDSTTPHHYYIANASTGFPSIISYFWSWGDGTYDTIAYPSHTYSAAGNYKICLTVSNGMCTSTYCDSSYLSKSPNSIISVTVIPGTTGISVNELADRINVYPNPTTGNLQIQTSMQIKNIEITDITGRLLYTTSVKTIDCSNFARGVYFIRATTEKGIAVKKFIKE